MDAQAYSTRGDNKFVCVRLRGRTRADDASSRIPVHFCVLLDNSGSMNSDNKLKNVIKSLDFILNILTEKDYISVISFSDIAKVIVSRTPTSSQHHSIISSKFHSIHPTGGTNMSIGFIHARSTLAVLDGYKQGILLLTDGHVNEGDTTIPGLVAMAKAIITEFPGTTISCVGYGTDHNDELLRAISVEGSGSYNIVNNLEDVASVFGDILGGLISCACQEVILEIPEGLKQITNLSQEGNKIRIGDIQDGCESTALFQVQADANVSEMKFTITGYNMHEKKFMNEIVEVKETDEQALTNHAYSTMLRANIAKLMERLRIVIQHYNPAELDSIKKDSDEFRDKIKAHMATDDNPILHLLIEEIDTMKEMMNMDMRANQHCLSAVVSQHTAYLTQARGIRTMLTPALSRGGAAVSGAGGAGDPVDSPYSNVFSNPIQRRISEGLRATASQAVPDEPSLNVWPGAPPHVPLSPPHLQSGTSHYTGLTATLEEAIAELDESATPTEGPTTSWPSSSQMDEVD